MMWYYSGVDWFWMAGAMVLYWGVAITLVILFILAVSRGGKQDQAIEVLRRRLAGGEISTEEFEATRKTLQK